jgi:hypothetical protein
VGVPLIMLPLKLKPAGRLPADIDHVYGATPPVATSDWLYTVPTTPFGSELPVVIVGAGGPARA